MVRWRTELDLIKRLKIEKLTASTENNNWGDSWGHWSVDHRPTLDGGQFKDREYSAMAVFLPDLAAETPGRVSFNKLSAHHDALLTTLALDSLSSKWPQLVSEAVFWSPSGRLHHLLRRQNQPQLASSKATCSTGNSVNHEKSKITKQSRQSSQRASEGKPENIFSLKYDPHRLRPASDTKYEASSVSLKVEEWLIGWCHDNIGLKWLPTTVIKLQISV